MVSAKGYIFTGFKRQLCLLGFFIVLWVHVPKLYSQESTLDNQTDFWTSDAAWTDGSNPGTTNIPDITEIYGTITRIGDLEFNLGTLTVHDTLLVYGNITFKNNSDLSLGEDAVVIIYGDYFSGNQVNVINGGDLVVMGEFEMQGANNLGSFTINDGKVFIFDESPIIKTGSSYSDLACPVPGDYPSNCNYGNELDFRNDPLFSFASSGVFEIQPAGPNDICFGDSVLLSVVDTASAYQWYKDGTMIPGAVSFEYYAGGEGYYHVEFEAGVASVITDSVRVNVVYCQTLGSRGPAGVGDSTSNMLWLRAEEIAGLNDGDLVDLAWEDLSGNDFHASQSNSSNQPVYLENGINGKAAVRFDGVSSYLENAYNYDAQTAFVVYSVNSSLQNTSHLGQLWGNYGDGVQVAVDPRNGNLNGFSFDGTPQNVTKARYGINGNAFTGFVADGNTQPWSPDAGELVAAEFENQQKEC